MDEQHEYCDRCGDCVHCDPDHYCPLCGDCFWRCKCEEEDS